MGTATLHWYSDRGFELDLEVAEDDVAIRLAGVPVPADGTAELRSGVDLDKLDILFKAVVEINGEPAQLHDARVQLVDEKVGSALNIDAKCEDVETGEIVPVRWTVGVAVPAGVPLQGGPRPVPTNEDDLDWEDETTLEQLVVNAPEASQLDEAEPEEKHPAAERSSPSSRAAGAGKGLQALLQALARGDDDDPLPPRSPPTGTKSGKTRASKSTPKTRASKSTPKATPSAQPARASSTRTQTPREAVVEQPAKTPAKTRSTRGTPAARTPVVPAVRAPVDLVPPAASDTDGPDQSLGEDGEARGLLDLLVEGGNLELEDDFEIDGLIPGVKKILSMRLAPEAKASKLSSWLLSQDQVADLFIADDDLAEILERW